MLTRRCTVRKERTREPFAAREHVHTPRGETVVVSRVRPFPRAVLHYTAREFDIEGLTAGERHAMELSKPRVINDPGDGEREGGREGDLETRGTRGTRGPRAGARAQQCRTVTAG